MNSKLMEELSTFFDKVKCVAPTRKIVITEEDTGAALKELHLSSTSCDLEKLPSETLCKGLWKDRHTYDLDCDGIVLLADLDKLEPTLLLVELKSTLSEKSLFKAIQQVVISLLKMHTLFSLCGSYNGILSPVKVLICCASNDRMIDWLKNISVENNGHLSNVHKLCRRLLSSEGEEKFRLEDVLKEISWAQSCSLPVSLLKLELEVQILCSDGEKTIVHSL
ncbi:hypothetical protein [Porphyromonas sp.]